jgi:hypothetical protein
MRYIPAIIASLVMTCAANASIIVSLTSGPLPDGGGNFAFNYRADLSGDERLDPVATDSSHATCPGFGGTKIPCNPAGTFFTLYDFNGFVSVASAPADWFATIQFLGITPSTINASFIDDPNVVNVTFFYTGPVVHGTNSGVAGVSFAGFQIISTLNGLNLNGNFASQSTKDTGDANGNTDQVTGPVTLPATSLPEPASLVLVGAGLMGLALTRRRDAR